MSKNKKKKSDASLPEHLNNYIQVPRPGRGLMFAAMAVLLAALIFWAANAKITFDGLSIIDFIWGA